jgi:hypothetical protein
MAQTITPVGHGGPRRRWVGAVALHVVGATLAAGALGAALGGLGLALGAPWGPVGALLVAGVAALYAARELGGVPVPIPQLRRQVPEWWRGAFSPGTASFLYGLGLGVGFATHLRHGTLVAVATAAVAAGDPLAGTLALAPFGIARAAAVTVAWPARDQRGLERLTTRLERLALDRLPAVVNGVALLAVVVAVAVMPEPPAQTPFTPLPSVILAAVFAVAAGTKLIRPSVWRETVAGHRFAAPLERVAIVVVPASEAVVAGMLVAGNARLGAAMALALLAAFSVALVRARTVVGPNVPCGCFGSRREQDLRVALARNAALAVLAVVVVTGRGPTSDWIGPPAGAEWVPATLAAAGIALTIALLRQAGGLRDVAKRPRDRSTG